MKPLPHLTPITEPVRELDREACGLPPREPTSPDLTQQAAQEIIDYGRDEGAQQYAAAVIARLVEEPLLEKIKLLEQDNRTNYDAANAYMEISTMVRGKLDKAEVERDTLRAQVVAFENSAWREEALKQKSDNATLCDANTDLRTQRDTLQARCERAEAKIAPLICLEDGKLVPATVVEWNALVEARQQSEQRLLMRIALLEEQNAGAWEINRRLHEQSGHLESIARQAMQLLEKNLPKLP